LWVLTQLGAGVPAEAIHGDSNQTYSGLNLFDDVQKSRTFPA
jgi:hypothetical protein